MYMHAAASPVPELIIDNLTTSDCREVCVISWLRLFLCLVCFYGLCVFMFSVFFMFFVLLCCFCVCLGSVYFYVQYFLCSVFCWSVFFYVQSALMCFNVMSPLL